MRRPEKTAPEYALTGVGQRSILAAQHGRRRRGRLARIGVLAAALLLAAPAVAAANADVTGFRIETTTFRPSADAFVNARHPNRNYGSSRELGADGRPHVHSFLRFRPRIGNATLKSARLGLYVRRGGSHRFAVARTSNHWRESRITWSNRPSAHRPFRHGRARRGRWVWVDVSALVRSGQPTSLRLATAGRRRLLFASRETRFAPKLRLTYEVPETPEASGDCFGAPADYVQAFDATDGVVDGRVMYSEPRVYLETQGWLTAPGQTPGHHSEHIHMGACFPQGETWLQPNDARTIDFRIILHNVVGYRVTKFGASFSDANNSGGGLSASAAQLAELNEAAAASRDMTVKVYQSYGMKPIGTNCRKSFRPKLEVEPVTDEALVDGWFVQSSWHNYFNYPGLPTCTPSDDRDSIRTRNWNGTSYHWAGFLNNFRASQMDETKPDPWNLKLSATHGTNQESLHIDPDFHHHPDNLGLWYENYSFHNVGEFTVTVPLVENDIHGIHKLVFLGHKGVGTDRPASTVVNIIPFKR